MTPMLFAHQGGWDEILFAVSPLIVVGLLLRLANQRAKKIQNANAAAAADPATSLTDEAPTDEDPAPGPDA